MDEESYMVMLKDNLHALIEAATDIGLLDLIFKLLL